MKICLDSEVPSYVLIHLFKDAMSKIGRRKKFAVESMDYDAINGLTVVDTCGVVWKLEVGASVVFPESLNNSIVDSEKARCFCPECNLGMSEEKKICSICEYLSQI